jgi:thymidylate synthase
LPRVNEIRELFIKKIIDEDFIIDKSGCKMIEIIGASFIADEPVIFGSLNKDYACREVSWYESQSLNVNDIPGETPKIWKSVATPDGRVNSNYGYLIYSEGNYKQYYRVLKELKKNPSSRRAVMIYTRPSIWDEYDRDGMSDFICTNAVCYFIRNNRLNSVVQMRSQDTVFGYKNDKYWQDHVLNSLADDLGVESGVMYWNSASLHVYERHFQLVK